MSSEWRVLALSISRAYFLGELLTGWKRKPNTNNFENADKVRSLPEHRYNQDIALKILFK